MPSDTSSTDTYALRFIAFWLLAMTVTLLATLAIAGVLPP